MLYGCMGCAILCYTSMECLLVFFRHIVLHNLYCIIVCLPLLCSIGLLLVFMALLFQMLMLVLVSYGGMLLVRKLWA